MSTSVDRAQRDADQAIADLVQAAKEESFEEGKTEGRQEAKGELADLVEGFRARVFDPDTDTFDEILDEVANAIRAWEA